MDFKYLNDFAPTNVSILTLCNPKFNQGQTYRWEQGKLLPFAPSDSITPQSEILFAKSAHHPKHNPGEVYRTPGGTLAIWRPDNKLYGIGGNEISYLGPTQTIWTIRDTDTLEKIFYHEQIDKNNFLVRGLGDQIFGTTSNLALPYHIPEICWSPDFKLDTKAFQKWKDSTFTAA